MPNPIVTLDQSSVRDEIQRQISIVATGNYAMQHNEKLLSTIDNIHDANLRTELLQKYLQALSRHQATKDTAMIIEVNHRITINRMIVENEIEKDKMRSSLFNSRYLLLFLWCFPALTGVAIIKYLDSFAYATFIVIILYGVLIALWFSKSTGLADTWTALTQKRRDL